MRSELALSAKDWLILLEGWVILLCFQIALIFFSYEKIVNLMRPAQVTSEDQAAVRADHIYRLLGYASRLHILGMTCLHRSLALAWMLSRRGMQAEIRIGVCEAQGEFNVHAWVEVQGYSVGEPVDIAARFRILKPLA